MTSEEVQRRPAGRRALACLALSLAVLMPAVAAAPRTPARKAPSASPSFHTSVPAPLPTEQKTSAAEGEKDYRVDAARHLYAAYAKRIYRGRLPPLLYSVMAVETEIDLTGAVVDVKVVRKPAVDEVAPWVVSMIRGAGPYPLPAKVGTSSVRYFEVWLVDRSGQFQVDTLTEGQR